jgi:cobalt-precorrin-5B (C1)-methyltransferase
MIREAVREVTDLGLRVTISIPGGQALAEKTFNPRLGVKGGLSILGTSGIVRPFSTSAIRDSLVCALRVADASGVTAPVFVPGRIGERAAMRMFNLEEAQLIETGNEWGFILDRAGDYGFGRLLVVGHPGKLAKLPDDQWDTHSSRSRSAAPFVETLALEIIGRPPTSSATVEAIFAELPAEDRERLAVKLAALLGDSIRRRMGSTCEISVVLVNLRGELLGTSGDLSPWPKRSS